MLFSEFVETAQQLEQESGRLQMIEILARSLKEIDLEDIASYCYLLLGQIDADYKGKVLGVSQAILVSSLSRLPGSNKDKIHRQLKTIGDLGEIAAGIIKESNLRPTSLTLKEIRLILIKISNKSSIQDKEKILVSLFRKLTPNEAKYVTRIIEGNLRIGVRESTIIDALALAFAKKEDSEIIKNAYYMRADLGYIARLLVKYGINRLVNISPKVGKPIIMMLAKPLRSAEEIFEKTNGRVAVEDKLDGLRLQAHIIDGTVNLWSRNLGNYNDQFPELLKQLPKVIKVNKAIIEGEIVAFDYEKNRIRPFQLLVKRRGRKYEITKIQTDIPVAVFWFDCLVAGSKNLIPKPYSFRRKMLEDIINVNTTSGGHKLVNMKIATSPEEIEDFFYSALQRGCEGIVAKHLDVNYTPGKRGDGWFKLKRDYQSSLADTIDCVVVGAFTGQGRRGGKYGSLLLAIKGNDGKYQTVSKLGSGLTDDILESLPKLFKPLITNAPKTISYNSQIKPAIWLIPELVVEVEAAEITKSPIHTAGHNIMNDDSGLALRFPRFKRWREDKNVEQITTEKELYHLWKKQLQRDNRRSPTEKKRIRKKQSSQLDQFFKKTKKK